MYIFNSFYLLHSYNSSFLICLCFNMVSLRGQKKLGARPDRAPLGVYFKISDEHPYPFRMQSPPPGLWSLVVMVRKLSHYTGKTDPKLDSLSFLTLITKPFRVIRRSAFGFLQNTPDE